MGENFTIDGDLGVGELTPGATKRRWEPEEGVTKLNERIHKESKYLNDHKNLEFNFSKPKKASKREWKKCLKCGHVSYVPKNTVGIICSKCKQYSSVEEV